MSSPGMLTCSQVSSTSYHGDVSSLTSSLKKRPKQKLNKALLGYTKRKRNRRKNQNKSDSSSDKTIEMGDTDSMISGTSSINLEDLDDTSFSRTPTPSECNFSQPSNKGFSPARSIESVDLQHWSDAADRKDLQPVVVLTDVTSVVSISV